VAGQRGDPQGHQLLQTKVTPRPRSGVSQPSSYSNGQRPLLSLPRKSCSPKTSEVLRDGIAFHCCSSSWSSGSPAQSTTTQGPVLEGTTPPAQTDSGALLAVHDPDTMQCFAFLSRYFDTVPERGDPMWPQQVETTAIIPDGIWQEASGWEIPVRENRIC
jgi:hypothetical protein